MGVWEKLQEYSEAVGGKRGTLEVCIYSDGSGHVHNHTTDEKHSFVSESTFEKALERATPRPALKAGTIVVFGKIQGNDMKGVVKELLDGKAYVRHVTGGYGWYDVNALKFVSYGRKVGDIIDGRLEIVKIIEPEKVYLVWDGAKSKSFTVNEVDLK